MQSKSKPLRVAFQSPCSLQHGQQLRGKVEALLRAAGYELTPVADGHLCCGSAGTYSILQPELSGQLRERKLAALARRRRPRRIATANIGCLAHLQGGTRNARSALDRIAGRRVSVEFRMETIVRAACPHDCPDTCAMLVTVKDGVAVKVQGDPSHPFTDGSLCTKVSHYTERTYAPDRLLHPLKRVGPKGKGEFKRISWDEALDEIAARLKALAAENPQSILPLSYAGTMGMLQYSSMDRRFFHKLGASQLERTLCSSAGKAGIKATLGGSYGMDPEHYQDAKLILIWGSNPITSNLHFWARAQEAKRRGAKLVAIDPYRSLTAEKCSQHVALLPGTDGALALGMMHVLIAEGLIDADYVSRYTLGYEELKERIKQYPPEWAAQTCGIAVEEVVQLARDYGTREAGGDPPQLRHAAPRRRRHGRAHHRLPAGADGRLARSGGRHPAHDRRQLPLRPREARAPGPDAVAAPARRSTIRSSATRSPPPNRRCAR